MSLALLGASRIGGSVNTAPDIDDVREGKAAIKRGMKGDSVEWVQKRVGVDTDGDFGNKTYAAVVKFQRDKGLSPDGVVGKKTVLELDKVGFLGTVKSLFTSDDDKPKDEAPAAAPAGESQALAPASVATGDKAKAPGMSGLSQGLIIGGVGVVVAGVLWTLAQDY